MEYAEWVERPMVRSRDGSYYHNMMNRTTELYLRTSTALRSIFIREDGAAMVEYALLIGLSAVVAVAAVALFGSALADEFDSIQASVNEANS